MSKSQLVRDYFKKHPNVPPKDALAELTEQGMDVSYALISKVKSLIGKPGGKRRKRRTAVAATGNGSSNGSAEGSTKAQAIRDTIKELGKRARPRDVIAALSEQGITVSSAQVSMVRKSMGLKKRRRAKAAATAGSVPEGLAEGTVLMSDLIAAKRLADSVGGVKVALKALATLERLS